MNWRMPHFFITVVLLVLGAVLGGACGRGTQTPATTSTTEQNEGRPELSAVPLGEGEKLHVVATTNIVADVVGNVGGSKIDLNGLLPTGTDPHTYEPTPKDLRAVARAHVIFKNGGGLEAFLDEMIRNAGSDAPVISVSHGVELLEVELLEYEAGEGEGHADVDPHTWFDPNNVVIWVHNIERALSALDPDNADAYATNAQAYVEKLEALDTWIQKQVAQVPAENKKFVTDHRLFGYFVDEYDFELVGAIVEAFSAAAEPSAQELAALENKIRQYGVPAIFVGRSVNPKLAQRVAEDTGIKLVRLYTGSLSEPGGEAGTYIDLMRYNVSAIIAALR